MSGLSRVKGAYQQQRRTTATSSQCCFGRSFVGIQSLIDKVLRFIGEVNYA
jgi:hypothetical protein